MTEVRLPHRPYQVVLDIEELAGDVLVGAELLLELADPGDGSLRIEDVAAGRQLLLLLPLVQDQLISVTDEL